MIILHDNYEQSFPNFHSMNIKNFNKIYCKNCSIIISTSNSNVVKEIANYFNGSHHLVFYTPHTYEANSKHFCWHRNQCLQNDILSKIHSILIYNAQALTLFPSFAHKMQWLPVSWAGTLGVSTKSVNDLKAQWIHSSKKCEYFVSPGFHARDWSKLLYAIQKINFLPLHIVGAKCLNPHFRKTCKQSLQLCQNIFPKCVLHNFLSKERYEDLISNACFVALPLRYATLGMGLTGVSEALLAGKVVVAIDSKISNNSQWTNYIVPNKTGILLSGNNYEQWIRVLESYYKEPERWTSLQKNAQKHAINFFSSNFVSSIIS